MLRHCLVACVTLAIIGCDAPEPPQTQGTADDRQSAASQADPTPPGQAAKAPVYRVSVDGNAAGRPVAHSPILQAMVDANVSGGSTADLVEALRAQLPTASDANRVRLVIFTDPSLSMALADGNAPPDGSTAGSGDRGQGGDGRPSSDAVDAQSD